MSIFQTRSNHPAPAQRHAELPNRDDPMVAATRCPGSRAQNGFYGGTRELMGAPAESRGCPTAPTQRHAALLKSADPTVAATRCPRGRAKSLEDGAKREAGTLAQSQACHSNRAAAFEDENVATASCNLSLGAPDLALRTAGGISTTGGLFVSKLPADHQTHGPSLGSPPVVFRTTPFGMIDTEAVQTPLRRTAAHPRLRTRCLRTGDCLEF
ncbi:hypothetical protein B0H14DRAFT_2610773 [Mycena olivaceomarginata]|nr:hypothetical protein B0H14DRAFT_2610773 [Mycena olivaceomarginata]